MQLQILILLFVLNMGLQQPYLFKQSNYSNKKIININIRGKTIKLINRNFTKLTKIINKIFKKINIKVRG